MSGFRRVVLELGHGAADPATLRQAAAFAQLAGVELHALFVEDDGLLATSALPFAREIDSLSLRWTRLEPERMAAGLRASAERARRHLTAAADAIGVRRTFEIRRGDLGVSVTEICGASDIVVLASPLRETTHGSRRLRDTAVRSAASVLYLPPRPLRRHGPIVAAVRDAADPALAMARLIAAQCHERLVVFREGERGVFREGDPVGPVLPDTGPGEINAALGDTRERLIVVTQLASHPAWASLAATRGVPVLVIERAPVSVSVSTPVSPGGG